MRFSDRVDETSLSYIRGRYGRESIEYANALNKEKKPNIIKNSTNSVLSEPKRQVAPPNKPLTNETPLQYARRMLKIKQEQAQ